MRKFLFRNRRIIGLVILLLALMASLYRGYLYKEKTEYLIYDDIENCCYIDYEKESIHYDSYEELLNNPPVYDGNAVTTINSNIPFFTLEDYQIRDNFILLSDLDEFGRSHAASSILNEWMLQDEERNKDLSIIKPSGFEQLNVKRKYNLTITYNDYSYNYLYQRCHILAYSLGGPEVDERDIFTGTFFLNVKMQTYEKAVSHYLRYFKGEDVLYRVTPVYKGDNLLSSGVLMEASDRNGELSFCVYLHNIQDGFDIDYATGKASYIPH